MGKKGLLALLSALFAIVAAYDIGLIGKGEPEPAQVGRRQLLPALRLDLLERERRPYQGVSRDIFRVWSVESAPRKAAPAPAPEPQAQAPPPPPPPPPSEVRLFAGQARFMGSLEGASGRMVIITHGSDIYALRKGDGVRSRFRVEEISAGAIVLRDSSTGEEASMLLPR